MQDSTLLSSFFQSPLSIIKSCHVLLNHKKLDISLTKNENQLVVNSQQFPLPVLTGFEPTLLFQTIVWDDLLRLYEPILVVGFMKISESSQNNTKKIPKIGLAGVSLFCLGSLIWCNWISTCGETVLFFDENVVNIALSKGMVLWAKSAHSLFCFHSQTKQPPFPEINSSLPFQIIFYSENYFAVQLDPLSITIFNTNTHATFLISIPAQITHCCWDSNNLYILFNNNVTHHYIIPEFLLKTTFNNCKHLGFGFQTHPRFGHSIKKLIYLYSHSNTYLLKDGHPQLCNKRENNIFFQISPHLNPIAQNRRQICNSIIESISQINPRPKYRFLFQSQIKFEVYSIECDSITQENQITLSIPVDLTLSNIQPLILGIDYSMFSTKTHHFITFSEDIRILFNSSIFLIFQKPNSVFHYSKINLEKLLFSPHLSPEIFSTDSVYPLDNSTLFIQNFSPTKCNLSLLFYPCIAQESESFFLYCSLPGRIPWFQCSLTESEKTGYTLKFQYSLSNAPYWTNFFFYHKKIFWQEG